MIESIKRGDFDAEQNYSIAQINKEFEMILEEILPKKRLGELRDPNEIKYTHLIKLRVLQNAYDGSWENNGQ